MRIVRHAAVVAAFAAGFLGTLAFTLATTAPAAAQYEARCVVTDPTGTPLNIRARPQGAVVVRIRNGTHVRMVDIAYDSQGRPWAYVVSWDTSQPLGWVFRAFISCH